MGALLIWKVIIPFFSVACTFRAINRKLDLNETAAFFVVIALGDVMSLNFFFLVKVTTTSGTAHANFFFPQDFGSWREIGMSISHFGLANAIILVHLVLFAISHVIMGRIQVKTKDQ
jgi:phosphatidylinositol glycan class N